MASFWNMLRNKISPSSRWDKGNDIYGVREREFISPDDREGKLDYLDKNVGFVRSIFYHSYWRGWTEVRIDRPGKPYKVARVYTAPWIRQGLSDRNYVLVRVLYSLLLVAATVLFSFAMTSRIGSNYCIYVAALGMPTTIVMIVVLWVMVVYIKAARQMTLWEYRVSSVRLMRVCLIYSIGLAATALSVCVYISLNPGDLPLRQALNAALDILAAVCAFTVFYLEKRMKYIDIENNNQAPVGGKEIR